MQRRLFGLIVIAACLAAVPLTATASPPTWERLKRIHPKPEEYRIGNTGCGRAYIKASVDDTKAVAEDFGRYAEMLKPFKKSRIVDQTPDHTDVYVEVSILKGKGTIRATLRFKPAQHQANGGYVLHGRLIEGNVKRFDTTYLLLPVDGNNTQMDVMMNIQPKFPVPAGLVTKQESESAAYAVKQLRLYAERRKG